MILKVWLGYLSTFSPLIPLVIGVKRKPSLIWMYVLLGLVFNILIGKIFKGSRYVDLLANIYVFIEFFILATFFFRKLSKQYRGIIFFGIGAFIYALYNTIAGGLDNFNGFSAAVLSFFYIICCVLALYVIMIDTQIADVFQSSFFLFTMGLFIYFAGMFMLFSTHHYFKTHELLWGFEKHSFMSGIWMVNSSCNIIQAVIFAKAFFVDRKLIK